MLKMESGCQEEQLSHQGPCCGARAQPEGAWISPWFVFQGTAGESGGTSAKVWQCWGESKAGQRDGAYSLQGNRGSCPTM